MKRNIRLIPVILAAGVILESCAKELLVEQGNPTPTEEGSRVIAVSFASQSATKTALGGEDGLTPEFVGGEMVLVSNDETTQECRVTFSGERAIITTRLQGDLTAVYPASAAKYIPSEKTGDKIIDPDNVLISTKQSGTFAEANICMARMKDGEEKLAFHNKTAILKFYVDNSIGVYNLKVKSADAEIAEDSQEITVESKTGSLYADMPDNQDRRICYVAVKSGVDAGTLSFISHTTTQGCVRKSSPATGVTLEAGTMYNAFIPYYVQIGDQKWAYCNIGAFLPEEAGYYFSWGNTERYVFDGEWKIAQGFPGAGTVLNGGFSEDNYTKTSGNNIDSDIPANTTYDAAVASWGGEWHMPTKDDFKALYSSCGGKGSSQVPTSLATVSANDKGIYWCTSHYGKAGLLMVDTNQEQLFFPAAGYGYNTPLHGIGTESIYWSSSISNTAGQAYTLHSYNQEIVTAHSDGRHICLPIRPIYDEPAPVPNVFTVNEEGKRIEFTKGNLYWNGSAWALEANQYDYRTRKYYTRQCASCINGDKTSSSPEGNFGLFYWTKDASASHNTDVSSNDTGLGTETIPFFHEQNALTVGEEQGLYVLSGSEWDYLINRRTTLDRSASVISGKADAHYIWCNITVNNEEEILGVLLFPDYFVWPTDDGAPSQPNPSHINYGNRRDITLSSFSMADLSKLEQAGVVFLPDVGYWSYDHRPGWLGYWTSTAAEGEYAYNFGFSSSFRLDVHSGHRDSAFAIRLVKNYSASNN